MFVAMLSGMPNNVSAVSAVPWAVEKVQPDGTKITVRLRGDENLHWIESLDGYTLMYDTQKFLVYADKDAQGNLVPTGVKFGIEAAPAFLQKGLRYSAAQANTLSTIKKITTADAPQKAAVGQKKVLAVLVDFVDRPMIKTTAEFDALMNQVGYNTGGAKGSVKDFYLENSYGQLDLEVTVVGPYSAPNTTAYYASNQREFANFAVDAADADVDYADFAVDGIVETFHIIFAGYGDESIDDGNQIWSHAWTLNNSYVTKDGVKLARYSCSPELRGSSGTNLTYIGVIAHELGHVFGSPDYYDTDYSGFSGTGAWDLMASGSWNDNGRQPAHINPYQKIKYGWISPETLTPYTSISDMPASAFNPVIYKMQVTTTGEHYLFENKQNVGFDSSLPGHGLLIWHVAASLNDEPNDTHPQQLYPVCASSTTAVPNYLPSSYGSINSDGCPFPGTSGNTSFTDISVPQAFSWSNENIGKPITGISENGQLISFDYMLVNSDPVINLQATVNGAAVTLTWDRPDNEEEINGYNIYMNGSLIYSTNSGETRTFVQPNVINGTYTFEVSIKYPIMESPRAAVDAVVTNGSTGCIKVNNLKAESSLAGDKVTLTWTPISIAVKYKIYRNGVEVGESTSASFADTGLTSSTVYSYCVSAVYSSDCISESICLETVTSNPYLPVSSFTATADGDNVSLQWVLNGSLPQYRPAYNVYDNEQPVATGITTKYLKLSNVSQGQHNYCVEAVYSNGTIKTASKCATVDVITGINDISAPDLKIYPNPVRAGVPFTVENATNADILVFNLLGGLVQQKKTVGGKAEITINKAGVYIVRSGYQVFKVEIR